LWSKKNLRPRQDLERFRKKTREHLTLLQDSLLSRLFYKKERNFGYFSRLMLLPSDVQNKSVTADYKRGVLTIIIPKKESNNPVETGTRINVL